MDSWFQCSSHLFNWQRTSLQSQNGLYLPRKEIQKHRQILLISNLVTLEQYPAFSVGVSFTQTATKSVRALGTRMIVGQKKNVDYPDELGSPRNFKPLFQSVLCTSALFKSMLSSKQSYSTPNSLLKYNYPSVFRRFLLQFRRDLSPNDRAEFKFWC